MMAILDEIGCPKCQNPMQEGFVLDRGDRNSKIQPARVEGALRESFWGGLKTGDRLTLSVTAFRCPKCNYLEFYTAEAVSI